MKEIALVSQLQGSFASPTAAKPAAAGFVDSLNSAISRVNGAQVEADRAVEQLHAGEAKNLHEVMITMEKADISLRLMVQMRNKAVEAYQEIMRMQV
ncbi:MAG: flagellar hook-basal body complex protein FliE [Trichloromonadaceae bacterium]